MKSQKGISLIKLILIVTVVALTVFFLGKYLEVNKRKKSIIEYNEIVATYNLDVLNKNKIILKYYPNISNDLLYKEVKRIPLETANSKNYNTLINSYYSENVAIIEFNDALLKYYKAILE